MRKYIAPIVVGLLALAPAGAVFAATTTAAVTAPAAMQASGTIKSLDLTAHTLVLADGSSYVLPADFKLPANLKVGEKVTVHWKMNGTAHDVTAIDIG